jgi:hypothetical protein|tara:strand:- start:1301 stop:1639 length:339 start_codon:yes stop_codon:yes gene_type:complete
MGRFASGKNSYGISDRSGMRYRLREMKLEWNGSLVGPDEFERKHPQLGPFNVPTDGQAVRNARPDSPTVPVEFLVFTTNPIDKPTYADSHIPKKLESFKVTGSIGAVTVSVT